MKAQLDLFADPRPPLPAANWTKTSRAAAHAIREGAQLQRQRVLAFIVDEGDRGATNDELVAQLGVLLQSTCGRANELWKAGLIRDSGRTRPTRTGHAGKVWVATEAGIECIREAR